MKTIKDSVSAEITEKKSKFISNIFYIEDVKQAEEKIEEINKKYHDARHNCFSYRVLEENSVIERASDDGEPSGTAGAPMLQILAKNELVNILVVVTRYFGGILLGTGGLVRAYSQATNEGLAKAEIVTLEKGERVKIPVSYQSIAYLQYYCRKNNIEIIKTDFENNPYIIIETTTKEKEKLLREMQEKQLNMEDVEIIQRKYIKG